MTCLASRQAHSTAERSWSHGPEHPDLTEGALHIWRVDLGAVPDALTPTLSRDEQARADRILRRDQAARWVGARKVLKELLGRYLGEDPRALRLVHGQAGKPQLREDRRPKQGAVGRPLPRAIAFNLSHSGGLALYSFTRISAVGVDVEVPRRRTDELATATRAFGPAEARRLGRLEPQLRQREFMRAWTRHEAKLKCLGTGLGAASAGRSARQVWIADLDVGLTAIAAVALHRPAQHLHCWDWQARPQRASPFPVTNADW